jgi:predicted RNA-binding Zn-ribbon protein involved in translation (DUF1610 family)
MNTQFEKARQSTSASRRLVALERNYECASCGAEHRSWTRMRACPDCGEHLAVAVIRRAALASA